jgi:hypothetical protein
MRFCRITATISSTRGGSAGYRLPLLAVDAADKMVCSPWTAYKWRTAARYRGFLDGDELTDHARQILDGSDSRPR